MDMELKLQKIYQNIVIGRDVGLCEFGAYQTGLLETIFLGVAHGAAVLACPFPVLERHTLGGTL